MKKFLEGNYLQFKVDQFGWYPILKLHRNLCFNAQIPVQFWSEKTGKIDLNNSFKQSFPDQRRGAEASFYSH